MIKDGQSYEVDSHRVLYRNIPNVEARNRVGFSFISVFDCLGFSIRNI